MWENQFQLHGGPMDGQRYIADVPPWIRPIIWGLWREKKVYYRWDDAMREFRYIATATFHAGPGNGGVEVTDGRAA
jgi:hypothetical protein